MSAVAFMQCLAICLFLVSAASASHPEPIIKLPSAVAGDSDYCESWKLAVETNNAGHWTQTCEDFAKSYMTGYRYLSDSISVASYAREFARSVNVADKDAWIFGIDDTLLSSVPNFYPSDVWDDNLDLPVLPVSLELYKTIQKLGFKIILLTGRKHSQLNNTIANLCKVGYTHWDKLIIRDKCDEGKSALVFKSEKRIQLVEEGYTIQGNCGDQWSDLLGYATAVRSFKFPNLMFYTK